MTNDQAVSVVIPTYNRAKLIAASVASVLAAVCEGDEIIVVDDGSTDATEQALAPYRSHIRYLRIPNSGAGAARNYGVRAARHDLIAFNDSDDFWMRDKLQLQRILMRQRPDVLFCFSDFRVKLEDGSEVPHYIQYWHADTRSWEEIVGPAIPFSELGVLPDRRQDFLVYIGDIYRAELEFNYVLTTSLMVRRSMAGDALHFAEDVTWGEDWECYGRLARAGPAAYLDCETAWQVGHSEGRLTDADSAAKAAIRLKFIERVWGADTEFLERHAELYRRTVVCQHLVRARRLMALGQPQEARRELKLAGEAPISYRMLAALPGWLVVRGVRFKRALRRSTPEDQRQPTR